MTQEEKQLLLKDLCARLPYEVILLSPNNKITYQTDGNTAAELLIEEGWKPYLRPMSNMTEEEKEELKEISINYLDEWENTKTSLERWKLDAKVSYKRAVFYNSHYIDWNDLIPKGLAIEVTEENNPYKE